MSNYLVTWEIELEANSPEEAAKEAMKFQRDPDGWASMFTVWDTKTGKSEDVDIEYGDLHD